MAVAAHLALDLVPASLQQRRGLPPAPYLLLCPVQSLLPLVLLMVVAKHWGLRPLCEKSELSKHSCSHWAPAWDS